MNTNYHFLKPAAVTLLIAFICACQSPSSPPSTPPSMPSSTPPSTPPPQPSSQPPASSPASQPAQTQDQSASKSSPSQSSSGEPAAGESAPPGESSPAQEALAKAGAKLKQAGESLPQQASGAPAFPDPDQASAASGGAPAFPDPDQAPAAGGGEPALPDPEQTPAAAGETASQDSSQTASGGEPAYPDPEQTADGGGAEPALPDPLQTAEPGAAAPSGSAPEPQLSETQLEAIREAILTAGEALQTASDEMGDSASGGSQQAAEGALAEARVALIIAGQELQVAIESDGIGTEILDDIRIVMADANLAIILAGQVLQESGGDLPGASGSGDPLETLEDELNESLVVFDGKMSQARKGIPEQTATPAGGTISGGTQPGKTGSPVDQDVTAIGEHDQDAELNKPGQPTQTGRMPGPGETTVASTSTPDPEDIPDGQGDDIVARQLREAAMTEQDPELKEKLWEEYKKYKAGIGR